MATSTPARPRSDDVIVPPGGSKPSRVRPKSFTRRDALVLAASALAAFSLVWLLYERILPLSGIQGFVIVWFGMFLAMYGLAVRELEGSLIARDRVVAALVGGVSLAVLVPLIAILAYTAWRGAIYLRLHFFTETLEFTGPEDPPTAGGGLQAIVGTLEQVGIATLISVPLGVLTAVFLNEVGGRLRRPVRIFVDAMSGVPSIVAGLFVYIILVVKADNGFSGFAAAIALTILMLPTVTRTSEVVLRLVPGGLREASLALGAPEWRTSWNVVLPTARLGLITAVILGMARVVGETAPLIVTTLGNTSLNANPFDGPQDALPLRSYLLFIQGLDNQVNRAWLYAFVLIVLVLILFVTARVLGARRPGDRRRSRRNRAVSVDIADGMVPVTPVPETP